MAWTALGPATLLAELAPLVARYRAHADVRLVEGPVNVGTVEAALAERPTTLLLLEPPDGERLRERFAGPIVGETCIGWLRLGPCALAAYARSAAALHARSGKDPPLLVLLGPREARYCELLDQVESEAALSLVRWSAERIRLTPMLRGLRAGPAAALFVGHGVNEGWMAYGGTTAANFQIDGPDDGHEQVAVIFSLACNTGASGGFGDKMMMTGAVGAVVAPTGMSLHARTLEIAPAIARSLALAVGRSVDATLRQMRNANSDLRGYIVIGDPGIPICSAPDAAARCRAIAAPAPWATISPSCVV